MVGSQSVGRAALAEPPAAKRKHINQTEIAKMIINQLITKKAAHEKD
jgi:hypothetical protein